MDVAVIHRPVSTIITDPDEDVFEPPDALPRATMDLPEGSLDELFFTTADAPHLSGRTRTTEELTQPRARAIRGTPQAELTPSEQIRTMVFALEPIRAKWIEGELARAPVTVTIQIGRRVRTIVAALVRDPPPRPEVLIVDFDAISPAELLELHAIRQEGWFGRLIGLGKVPPALCTSLGVDHVLKLPLVRDSLLDCVAGTRHAAVTEAIPVILQWDE